MRPTEVISPHPPVAITEGVEYRYYSSNEPVGRGHSNSLCDLGDVFFYL